MRAIYCCSSGGGVVQACVGTRSPTSDIFLAFSIRNIKCLLMILFYGYGRVRGNVMVRNRIADK